MAGIAITLSGDDTKSSRKKVPVITGLINEENRRPLHTIHSYLSPEKPQPMKAFNYRCQLMEAYSYEIP